MAGNPSGRCWEGVGYAAFASLLVATAASGCAHATTSPSAAAPSGVSTSSAASSPSAEGRPTGSSGSGLTYAQALRELCGAAVGDGLHGDAHIFEPETAADAIIADTPVSSTDPGVSPAQFRQALQAGQANIYRENPSRSLTHIDGIPVPGPSRISATTILPANSEVDFFFTCGKADLITH